MDSSERVSADAHSLWTKLCWIEIAQTNSYHISLPYILGSFLIDKVVPQANGESSKVKVKVRVNILGIFTTSSASLVEKTETPEEEAKEEPMEVISLLLKSNANILNLVLGLLHLEKKAGVVS